MGYMKLLGFYRGNGKKMETATYFNRVYIGVRVPLK